MVRSGNCDCLADLATRLGHHRAYAVEFIELGLGDPSEAPRGTTADNALGFHGNAVTSALPLKRPFLIRLDVDGCWFGPERGQQRVGGRMQVVAASSEVFKFEIDMMEELGAGRLLYGQLAGTDCVVATAATTALTDANQIFVRIPPEAIHLFDAGSGARIEPGAKLLATGERPIR